MAKSKMAKDVQNLKHLIAAIAASALCFGVLTGPALAAEQTDTALPAADPPGTVTWENLDSRIRTGSLNARALSENIAGIEGIDFELMREDLRQQLNDIASVQWLIITSGGDASSMDQAYDSLRDTFDDLKDGVMQADYADMVWQLKDAENQVVAGGENLYLNLIGLEQQLVDGQRNLAAVDRSLEELRLRQRLGQVSNQAVDELEQTRAELVSQMEQLESTGHAAKVQLQKMIGADPAEEITLAALPTWAESEWMERDYDADLESAKGHSWALRSAEKTLEDAKETWADAKDDYRGPRKQYLYQQAEHTWNAAQLTYQSSVDEFEQSFKKLYDSLADCERALKIAQSKLAQEENTLAAAQLRYRLGLVSQFQVLDAQDNVAAAQSAADSAWHDLLSARTSYSHAVEWGLL